MRAENAYMTPISQHNYSLASVSYLGPAYAESQDRPQGAAQQQGQPSKSGAQRAAH